LQSSQAGVPRLTASIATRRTSVSLMCAAPAAIQRTDSALSSFLGTSPLQAGSAQEHVNHSLRAFPGTTRFQPNQARRRALPCPERSRGAALLCSALLCSETNSEPMQNRVDESSEDLRRGVTAPLVVSHHPRGVSEGGVRCVRASPSHMKHTRRRVDKSSMNFTCRLDTFQLEFHWTFFRLDSDFLCNRRFL
jgi:hypothetical protein